MHWAEKLNQFTCTTHYWPLGRNVELSDGASYVATAADARWLMLVIARELDDMNVDYWHLRVLVTRVLYSTSIKFIDTAGNRVCSTVVSDRTLDVQKFELRAGWTGDCWMLMLPTEDIR